jgi:hypothetical protein
MAAGRKTSKQATGVPPGSPPLVAPKSAELVENCLEKQPDGTRLERFAGIPAWITPELIKDTLQTWQPYYNQQLSEADAVEILQSVGRLLDVM